MSAAQLAQGDSFPFTVGLRDTFGKPVYPPAGSTASFRMVERQSRTVVAGTASISPDPTTLDQVTWTPSTSDTAVPGTYDAQFTVIYPNGEVRRFPTKIGPSALDGLVIEVCPAA